MESAYGTFNSLVVDPIPNQYAPLYQAAHIYLCSVDWVLDNNTPPNPNPTPVQKVITDIGQSDRPIDVSACPG